MHHFILNALRAAAFFLLLSACTKPPTGPDEIIDEPDTAKSSFRAFIIAPEFNNVITIYNNDTLSNGRIPRRNEDGSWGIRQGDIIRSTIQFSKYQEALVLSVTYYSSLVKQAYINPNNRLDSLRSWKMLDFGFRIAIPQNFQSGFSSSDSNIISVLDWSQSQWSEHDVPSTLRGTTTWSITSLFSKNVDVRYDKYPLSFQTPATIEFCSITIDNYDAIRKRIYGRINFKMLGKVNQEVIELRDGIFENVAFFIR